VSDTSKHSNNREEDVIFHVREIERGVNSGRRKIGVDVPLKNRRI
jgi:hypothetical protein